MKTIEEWSNAFDTLVAEYIHNKPFGVDSPLAFDEYEKSLFLTESQKEVVKGIYTGSPFESTEEARRSLDALIKQSVFKTLSKVNSGLSDKYNHYQYNLDQDCWYIIFEQAVTAESEDSCANKKTLDVIPVTHDEYHRVSRNPFKGPNSRRVLRLDVGKRRVELISTLDISSYLVRYLSMPTPIVLSDFSKDGLEIDGVSSPSICILSEIIHPLILERAVQKAVSTRSSQSNK